jgi:RNA polymerase sigma-70 factor (ECF subfamily)
MKLGRKNMIGATPDSTETRKLLSEIEQGDRKALDQLLLRHRQAVRDFVEHHFDPRLRARLDPSDVVQETLFELANRMPDFLAKRPMPFRLWLRRKAYEKLLNHRRDHMTRARRSVIREVPWPDRSSILVVRPLLGRDSAPSRRLQNQEMRERIARAVQRLAEGDREILLMRHAEDLAFEDIGCLLEVTAAAARKRFGRALIRLQKLLTEAGLLES